MMRCPKCQKEGMHLERVYTDAGILLMWGCIFCGEAIDPVVLYNRGRRVSTAELQRVPKGGQV